MLRDYWSLINHHYWFHHQKYWNLTIKVPQSSSLKMIIIYTHYTPITPKNSQISESKSTNWVKNIPLNVSLYGVNLLRLTYQMNNKLNFTNRSQNSNPILKLNHLTLFLHQTDSDLPESTKKSKKVDNFYLFQLQIIYKGFLKLRSRNWAWNLKGEKQKKNLKRRTITNKSECLLLRWMSWVVRDRRSLNPKNVWEGLRREKGGEWVSFKTCGDGAAFAFSLYLLQYSSGT